VATEHPAAVTRLTALAERARADLGDLGTPAKDVRPAGRVEDPQPMLKPAEPGS